MSSKEKIKLALGVPAYGGTIDAAHAGTWMGLGFALRDTDSLFIPILGPVAPNVQPVCQARNRLLKMALDAGADWLLTIDADVAHEGKEGLDGGYDLLQMVKTGDKLGAAIIGAAVPQRTDGETHLMAYVEMDNRAVEALSPAQRYAQENRGGIGFRPVTHADFEAKPDASGFILEDHGAHRVIPVARVSGSCWAINVDFVRRCMPTPPWFLFAYAEGTLRQLGEDLWFCDEVRKRGGSIYVDGRFTPMHRRPGGWMEAPGGAK